MCTNTVEQGNTTTSQRIANNLVRDEVVADDVSVAEFLTSCGMERYADMFISNGFEDMETMFELEEEHLAQLNIPLGHRLKIVRAIKYQMNVTGVSKIIQDTAKPVSSNTYQTLTSPPMGYTTNKSHSVN